MKKVLLILLLAIGFYVVKTLYQAGQFKSIEDHFEGTVTTIYHNMPGPEDMQVDHETGLMFISAAIRRFDVPNQQKEGIYLLDLENGDIPKLLTSSYTGGFSPHGISLLRVDSSLYVFVVNHNSEGDFIESFLFENGGLTHLMSYSSPMMCCPNDVVATGIDKFYVTNDHGTKAGFMRTIEDYGRIPRSSVLYFNGREFTKVAKPYLYANGINISKDGQRLYLAATTGASLTIFDIADDNSLTTINTVDLGTGVDNIDVDEEGNLWIGCHPKLLAFVGHAKDSTKLSPSQILKLTPLAADEFKVEEVYLNSGAEISGSTTGLFYKDELFIGVAMDHTMLRAEYKN